MAKLPNRSGNGGNRAASRVGELESIALLPEIAVARVGSSTEPLACYDWSKVPDTSPRGSGKTTLTPKPTLRISPGGEIQPYQPDRIEFTEQIENGRSQLHRPVCPWFVVFAKWRNDPEWRILLRQDLKDIGVPATGVCWHVMVANRKAYNMSLKVEDIVYAEAAIGGEQDDHYGKVQRLIEQRLTARSDMDYWTKYSEFRGKPLKVEPNPDAWLIPPDEQGFGLGRIQAPVFSERYGIRLRFIAPPGVVYGPRGLRERIDTLLNEMTKPDRDATFDDWTHLNMIGKQLAPRYCILNPHSGWAQKQIGPGDEVRTLPGPQFAHIQVTKNRQATCHSLGLLDDFSDGIVTVTLAGADGTRWMAKARIVVGPPDLAPDRRHPLTLYDALDDRAYLADSDGHRGYEGHPDKLSKDEWRQEVMDLFRHAYETAGLMNVDAMDNRLNKPFRKDIPRAAPGELPLTRIARDKHRRLASPEALEDLLREQEKRQPKRRVILEPGQENTQHGLINLPPGPNGQVPEPNSFDRMVPVMRGSHFAPMHLTKRKIEVLRRWRETLKPRKP